MSFNVSNYFVSQFLQCAWRDQRVDLFLPEFFTTSFYWQISFHYTFTSQLILSDLKTAKHLVFVDNYYYQVGDSSKALGYFGTRSEQFTRLDLNLFNQSAAFIDEVIILITKWPKPYCEYVCDSVATVLPNITVQDTGTGNLLVTVKNQRGHQVVDVEVDDRFAKQSLDKGGFLLNNYTSYSDPDLIHTLTIYMSPNNASSCNNANIWNLSNTMVTLSPDCPSGPYVKNGFIRRNTTASCRCLLSGETFPSSSVQWFDATGLNVSQSGKFSDLIIDGSQESGQYFCYETRFNDKTKRVAFKLDYFDVPEVVNVTVNGVDSVNVSVGDTVTIYCQVKSTDPPSKAVLLASGLGSVKEIISTNETLELSLRDLQCEDSGRYNCTGRNGFEDSVASFLDYVDINIKCPIKSVQKSNTFPIIRVSPNENTVFTFEVYGYPEPTQYVLKTETGQSTSLIDQSKYKVTFLRLTPPLGQITVTVYDANTSGTTTYVLSVTNDAGEIILKYQVIKEQFSQSSEIPVSQIIGGCVGGLGGIMLVSASIGILLWFVKRRRHKGSPGNNESYDVPMPDTVEENRLQAEQTIYTEIHFVQEDNRNSSNDTTV
ncbi:uncharacterized protein LOC106059801 [Biomphalaria glabrata]|uniref:Uncharacterized protein LOC106059801 n=1 Tax=Biomphalaria glabrata TaxID=6526 RepID=A0A9W2Z6P2_BIOGL|nr:uncharacterized protein LOC106059801 [Biomphalaria glabrata]